MSSENDTRVCACGCGTTIPVRDRRGRPHAYVSGHNRKRDPVTRFWEKVKRGPECWEWQASGNPSGYGQFNNGVTMRQAHRFSYELHFGPIPDGLFVCHRCDNPRCVRPDHLFAGTAAENVRDMIRKGKLYQAAKPHLVARGERTRSAVLTEAKVREIRRRYRAGETGPALAKEFGVGFHSIYAAVYRRTWKHVA